VLEGNVIQNVFNVEVLNKTYNEFDVKLKLAEDWDAKLTVMGNNINVEPEDISSGIFTLEIPKEKLVSKSTKIPVEVWSDGELIDEVKIKFLRP
jgi:hypothetical protein